MKLKIILLLGILVSALVIAYSRIPTLEEELYWYSSEGFSIYRQNYKDYVNEIQVNRTLSERRVSRLSLRQYVPYNHGIVYYDSERELLFCADEPESSAWVYMYYTDIKEWSRYWHAPGTIDEIRDRYFIAQ
jgi:hypothetical protein